LHINFILFTKVWNIWWNLNSNFNQKLRLICFNFPPNIELLKSITLLDLHKNRFWFIYAVDQKIRLQKFRKSFSFLDLKAIICIHRVSNSWVQFYNKWLFLSLMICSKFRRKKTYSKIIFMKIDNFHQILIWEKSVISLIDRFSANLSFFIYNLILI
jgi:hypothetical protein